MERIEEEMQVEKIYDLKYLAFLLERIAWNTSRQYLEERDYTGRLRSEYASGQPKTAGILRDLRTRSRTCEREMPKHVEGQNVGVRVNPQDQSARQENVQPKK